MFLFRKWEWIPYRSRKIIYRFVDSFHKFGCRRGCWSVINQHSFFVGSPSIGGVTVTHNFVCRRNWVIQWYRVVYRQYVAVGMVGNQCKQQQTWNFPCMFHFFSFKVYKNRQIRVENYKKNEYKKTFYLKFYADILFFRELIGNWFWILKYLFCFLL